MAAAPAEASPAPVVLEPALEHIGPPPPAHDAAGSAEPEPEAEPDKDSASSPPKEAAATEIRESAERQTSFDHHRPEDSAAAGAGAATRPPARRAGWFRRSARHNSKRPVPVPQPFAVPPPPAPMRPAPAAVPAVPSFVPTPVGLDAATACIRRAARHRPRTAPRPRTSRRRRDRSRRRRSQFAPQPTTQVKVKADRPNGFTAAAIGARRVSSRSTSRRIGSARSASGAATQPPRGATRVPLETRGRSPSPSPSSRFPRPLVPAGADRPSPANLARWSSRQVPRPRPRRRLSMIPRYRRAEGASSSSRNRPASRSCSIASRSVRRRCGSMSRQAGAC